MIKKHLALAAVAALALTGCSANHAPTPTPTNTATPSASPAPMTAAQAKANYKLFAKASCLAAQDFGVAESSTGRTAVMTASAKNYKDYNAALFREPDKYTIIWELTGLIACADWYRFSMAEEAGKEAAIGVNYSPANDQYQVVQNPLESTSVAWVSVVNGKIATSLDVKTQVKTTLKYGDLTEAESQILVTAVDQYLESIG